ncbi:sepiapterin reductase isoform X3 [Cephus cinctus]|uniref:Sepiapterin reductase n=1 Tax=Cephus cinctus TaxID=211228 RepID=A0AAJ7RBD0_CEPCN|nr:sepiapterin reductase isoform X3 [Cephus cinctus]
MSIEKLSGKVFLLITGASQGIGRQIAETFSTLVGDGSHVLLLARNATGLKETVDKLRTDLKVDYASVDLSIATPQELKIFFLDIIKTSFGKANPADFQLAVIIHNAGSVGDVSKSTIDMTDIDYWRKYYDLNVFSPAILNGVFLELLNEKTNVEKLVINITSLCGIQEMKTLGYYCSGKAAREMFFKVFAAENPQINVLNYSPGPVETDMLRTICREAGDLEIKTSFNEMRDKNGVLSTEQTVNHLVEVLKAKKYKSGAHVDYFDEL